MGESGVQPFRFYRAALRTGVLGSAFNTLVSPLGRRLKVFLFCFAIGGISAVAPEWRLWRNLFQTFRRPHLAAGSSNPDSLSAADRNRHTGY